MNQFTGQTIDELEAIREQINLAINGMADSTALAESIPGKKWVKRLQSDLLAIQSKYLGIKGSTEEMLRELSRLQGMEKQLKSELDLLTKAVSYEKRLVANLQELTEEMRRLTKPKISR